MRSIANQVQDQASLERATLPSWLIKELRSDHAGETGAVYIYRGILRVSQDADVREFATRHLETESRHLIEIEKLLLPAQRSRLLVIWRIAGFLTGAIPALFGPGPVFNTIEAVETFVDTHYQQQIDRLQPLDALTREQATIRMTLIECQSDEIAHREEAATKTGSVPGPLTRLWCSAVSVGSQAAVLLAKAI